MNETLLSAIGLDGIAIYVFTFAILSAWLFSAGNSMVFIALNVAAAIALSLTLIMGESGLIIVTQGLWIVLTIYGVAEHFLKKKKAKTFPTEGKLN